MENKSNPITPTTLTIKVTPRARRTELVGTMSDGTTKIRLRAVPEDGKANAELCRYLSELYGGEWEVIAGNIGTRKVVRSTLQSLSSPPRATSRGCSYLGLDRF